MASPSCRWPSRKAAQATAHDAGIGELLQRQRPLRGRVAAQPDSRRASPGRRRGRTEHRGCAIRRPQRLRASPPVRRHRRLAARPPARRMARRQTCLDGQLPLPTVQRRRAPTLMPGMRKHGSCLASWPDWSGRLRRLPPRVDRGRTSPLAEALRLIAECEPAVVFGEQVAGVGGLDWFAGVRGSLELGGYAVGGLVAPAASVGAPHRRERLFWVADAEGGTLGRGGQSRARPDGCVADAGRNTPGAPERPRSSPATASAGPPEQPRRRGWRWHWWPTPSHAGRDPMTQHWQERRERVRADGDRARTATDRADAGAWPCDSRIIPWRHRSTRVLNPAHSRAWGARVGRATQCHRPASCRSSCGRTRPCGFWLLRHTETRPRSGDKGATSSIRGAVTRRDVRRVATRAIPAGSWGSRPREGGLRAYGNAIVPQVAAEFVRAYLAPPRVA